MNPLDNLNKDSDNSVNQRYEQMECKDISLLIQNSLDKEASLKRNNKKATNELKRSLGDKNHHYKNKSIETLQTTHGVKTAAITVFASAAFGLLSASNVVTQATLGSLQHGLNALNTATQQTEKHWESGDAARREGFTHISQVMESNKSEQMERLRQIDNERSNNTNKLKEITDLMVGLIRSMFQG